MNIGEVPVGTRITTRYLDVDGLPNEAVGHIVSNDGLTLVLEARRGTVEIPLDKLEVWRVVPPARPRPPRRPGLPQG